MTSNCSINSGTEPREAWINPAGGHMGRTADKWPDPVIFRKIILPWEVRHLNAKAARHKDCGTLKRRRT